MKLDEATGIMYREWISSGGEIVFLLVHGLGAHSARWDFLSDFLLQNGISSYALELKGFGETKGLKGHIDSFDVYFDDIISLRDIIIKEHPGKKIFLLGESLGGVISFLLAGQNPDLFSGLICISPAFRSKMKVNLLEYIKMFAPLIYNPKKHLTVPFTSNMCTRDTEFIKVMDQDEREHRVITSKFLLQIIVAQLKSRRRAEEIKIPVLFLIPGEDKLVDSRASKTIFEKLKGKDKELIEYPGMYHALSIDLGREQFFKDILNWVRGRI